MKSVLTLAGAVVFAICASVTCFAKTTPTKKLGFALERNPKYVYKAWIYFTDKKGAEPKKFINKRSLWRRNKVHFQWSPQADGALSPKYLTAIQSRGVGIRMVSRWLNAVSIEATESQLRSILALPFVLRIDQIRTTKGRKVESVVASTPKPKNFWGIPLPVGDMDYGLAQGQLEQIGVPELHKKGLTGKGVIVAVFDEGFQVSHEAFSRLTIKGQHDFIMNDDSVSQDPNNPKDYGDNHGTMAFSALAGYAPGKMMGPAFGATFLLAKTEDSRSESMSEEDAWIGALEWAEENGADIVSSSVGYKGFDNGEVHPYESLDGNTLLISRAASMAAERGVLIVNSVGNGGSAPGSLNAPADAQGILSVGAVNPSGNVVGFSSRGPTYNGRIKPEVVAQGYRVYVATNRGYGYADGTSFSAPLVAGTAALLLEAHPQWGPLEIIEALTKTASNARSPDNNFGFGIINAMYAFDYKPLLAFKPGERRLPGPELF